MKNLKKSVVFKAFFIYLIVRVISAIWIYLVIKYRFFIDVNMGSKLTLFYLLWPSLIALLVPFYFWHIGLNRLAKWLMFFLIFFLLFGSSLYVGIGLPLLFVFYDFFKENRIKISKK